MRGPKARWGTIAAVVLTLAVAGHTTTASAATPPSFQDAPATFFAHSAIDWTVANGWTVPRTPTTFGVGLPATRQGVARVLAKLAFGIYGTPVQPHPYEQAVAAGWIAAGAGPTATVTQLELDRGVVNVLHLVPQIVEYSHARTQDGWTPPYPTGFGVEQVVRSLGIRPDIPQGFDSWELWPTSQVRRADLAWEAQAIAGVGQANITWAKQKAALWSEALPAWTPLQRAVLGFALRWSNAPYVYGGTSPDPQELFGLPTAGGFDCSGFVWWVMKLQTYTVGETTWSGNSAIGSLRTTEQMAQALPVANRIAVGHFEPGDVLMWSSPAAGVNSAWQDVYHVGIALGNGWEIASGSQGVQVQQLSTATPTQLAFGWRLLPAGE
jgi:cell wall-associated NlpC family hydrolase